MERGVLARPAVLLTAILVAAILVMGACDPDDDWLPVTRTVATLPQRL